MALPTTIKGKMNWRISFTLTHGKVYRDYPNFHNYSSNTQSIILLKAGFDLAVRRAEKLNKKGQL